MVSLFLDSAQMNARKLLCEAVETSGPRPQGLTQVFHVSPAWHSDFLSSCGFPAKPQSADAVRAAPELSHTNKRRPEFSCRAAFPWWFTYREPALVWSAASVC